MNTYSQIDFIITASINTFDILVYMYNDCRIVNKLFPRLQKQKKTFYLAMVTSMVATMIAAFCLRSNGYVQTYI